MSWVSGVIWSLVSRVIWSPDPIILTSCNSSVTTQSFTFELTPDWSIIAVSCSWLADDTPLLHTRTQLWLYWLVFYPQLITISPFINTMEMVFIFLIIVSSYSSKRYLLILQAVHESLDAGRNGGHLVSQTEIGCSGWTKTPGLLEFLIFYIAYCIFITLWWDPPVWINSQIWNMFYDLSSLRRYYSAMWWYDTNST